MKTARVCVVVLVRVSLYAENQLKELTKNEAGMRTVWGRGGGTGGREPGRIGGGRGTGGGRGKGGKREF